MSTTHWSATTVERLRDATRCPVCTRPLDAGLCRSCGADLRGEPGVDVWQAASAAADALAALQSAVASIPRRAPSAAPDRPPVAPARARIAPVAPARASTTLQSVLAVAGAGLIALAALVFTLLNPDLTDPVARGAVLIAATLLFAVGAAVLRRRALAVSAECIAALALVFAGLAGVALAPVLPAADNGWAGATIGAALGGGIALTLGLRTRLRGWMLAGSIALTLVPLLAAAALGSPPATLWGPLGTAAVALALLEGASRLAARGALPLCPERRALVALQLLGAALLVWFIVDAWFGGPDDGWTHGTERWLSTAAAVLGGGAIAARSARHSLRLLWSLIAGASVPAALAIAALGIDPAWVGGPSAFIVLVPAGAAVGVLALTIASRADAAAHRRTVLAGAMCVFSITLIPHAGLATLGALTALLGGARASAGGDSPLDADTGAAVVLGLVVASAALGLQARLVGHRAGRSTAAVHRGRALSLGTLGLAGLGALGLTVVDPTARAIAAIVLVTATAAIMTTTAAGQRARLSMRLPIILASHAALVIAVSLSWQSIETAVTLGPAALVALTALARTIPLRGRAAHTAAGVGYALVLAGSALSLTGVGGPALLSLTATIGLMIAIAVTLVPRVAAAHWLAVLGVTTVPFALAVALVAVERSGWAALSTTAMIVLAVSLLRTRRPGLGIVVRALAGAVIVPSIAVVLVDLGAELLVMSGSPVVLPTIALLVAATLPAIPRLVDAVHDRGMPTAHATAVGRAIEVSTLLTAVITIALAYAREAAGPVTAIIVLTLLALGCATAARVRGAAPYWWASGAAATAALSTLWFELGVTEPEAHLLPPTIAAATIAAVLTARGTPRPELYGAALLTGIVPLLALLALDAEPVPARALGLVLASVGLAALGASIHPRASSTDGSTEPHRLASLRGWTLAAATVAGLAGAVLAARLGLGSAALATAQATAPTIVLVLLVALAGAVPAGVAGVLRTAPLDASARRWALVPAIAAVSIAAWTAVESTPLTVAVLWMLMLALLVTMTIAVAREGRGPTLLPRAWVQFALALGTAIAAWSTREYLRVEAFSLPLGLMLLVAGAIALRRPRPAAAAPLQHWPRGRSGSWPLLAPGLVVLVLASMLATATDPQTWRAVLVMALALGFILVGVRWRLAAPFVLGMIVLPLENVLAFSVQIGRGIEAMPWWITLAVVGLVLLVIAVGSERRGGPGAPSTPRLRDLR
ncbi:SCO7613 C-terminal domain-containing membrane protein [Microcella sp.]|uniref:SCO7613 C-terminal domain-containing membrane protein n=1 Tax=Microcella sp. TaxID=1913979 RepID=UPI0039188CC2